jgi:site-specific recombinase XerD
MKTKKKQVGKLYTMIHKGSVVISRKSMNTDVPYKQWDKKLNKVKSTYQGSNKINELIEEKIREFEVENYEIPTGNDTECALKFMKSRLNSTALTTGSKSKYNTILKNFETVIYEDLKMDSLPFKNLRDIKFIHILKNEIRKGRKGANRMKSNSSWFNYMTVFGGFVKEWNKTSGTQFPINILPFTTDIGKFTKKIANTLTHKELKALTEYEPVNSKKKEAQILSKNIFLFQYHTGGIRLQDALTLTNKEIKSNGFQIKIKKTNEIELFPFCYEQVECLKKYYSFEYNISLKNSEIGNINLDPNLIIQINRIEGIGDLSKLTLIEVSEIREWFNKNSNDNVEMKEFVEPLLELEELLKEEITYKFFQLLKKRPQSFILPKLNWDDFKESYTTDSDSRNHNERHEYLIHCARASQISNLKRISDNLGIEKMSGHTPRHTLANHLQDEGYTVEEIQKVLVHSNINTTKLYLKRRHNSNVVNKTVAESTKVFRKKRSQDFQRGF